MITPIVRRLMIFSILLTHASSWPLQASCLQPWQTLTEVLNDSNSEYHIFTCVVLKTYRRGGHESIAILKDRYRGLPEDTIYLSTGGITMEGGAKLIPGSEHLIVSKLSDGLHYKAYVCDRLSMPLSTSEYDQYDKTQAVTKGRELLGLLKDYLHKESMGYSGEVNYKLKDSTFATGYLLEGRPHGEWKHYESRQSCFGKLKSIINYKDGRISGRTIEYDNRFAEPLLLRRAYYSKKNLVWEETGFKPSSIDTAFTKSVISWTADSIQITMVESYDTLGKKVANYTSYYIPYLSKDYITIRYLHGTFLNLASKRPERGKGQYYRGKKYGKWTYYDADGKIIQKKNHGDKPKNSKNGLLVFEDKNGLKTEGKVANRMKQGYWKVYNNGKLSSTWNYMDNVLHGEISRFYDSNYYTLEEYDSGQLMKSTFYNPDSTIRITRDYTAGKADRTETFYTDNQVSYVVQYKKGRRNGYQNSNKKVMLINGYKQGPAKNYNGKGELRSEGDMWYGNQVGKWTLYQEDKEGYMEFYYETDPELLMRPEKKPSLHWEKWYDKNGKLLREENHLKDYR